MPHLCQIIPFPTSPRFSALNGSMVQATGFGLEVVDAQGAMNLNHELRMTADRHERDGEHARARLCRRWMDELSKAWAEVNGRIL